jgi:enamidase
MNMRHTNRKSMMRDNPGIRGLATIMVVTLGLFSACGNGTKPAPSGSALAITNCTLIDGTGNAPVPNATLVISEGLIVAVGPASSTPIPKRSEVVDMGGATVLPGFFNAHIHNGFSRQNLETWAQAGVTTVRDLCGPELFALKDELSEDPLCALLVAAGPMISVPNGYPLVPWGSSCMLPVNSAEDAEDKAARLIEEGADIIKLAVESGESFQQTISSLSPEEALAVVNTAHEHGTIASAHVLCASDLARAIEAGVDDIAHMVTDRLPDSLIEVMVEDSIVWIPTLELWHHVGYGLKDAAIGNLRKFVLAGGQVALGTDFDGYNASFQLGMPVHEMEWMLQAGMSSMQIIVAGTRNAARACNRLTDLGTLEAGKIADVLVVNGDPLADIHNLTNVRLVIRRGVIIRDIEP